MATQRQIQVSGELAHLAAEFLQRESNRQTLITVTRADISPDFAQATIYFTVLPQEAEEQALAFIKRQRTDFRTFVKKRMSLKKLPFFDFAIDTGEQHRQHIDTLL